MGARTVPADPAAVGTTYRDEHASAWRELDSIARQFAEVSARAAQEAVTMRNANAADLVGRLLQMASALPLLVADGQRASAVVEASELQELLRTKNDFVRMTTHELRRPLGILKGYISMLEDGTYGELPVRMRDASRHIGAAATDMADLVDGLIAIARLEDRADALRLAPNRLGQIVTEAIAAVEQERAAKNIHIETRISSSDPELDVDADRLRIAVVNLIGNAIKYGPESSAVTVATHHTGGEATITVADQGPGLAPAEADGLFSEWRRGEGADGPGLGLGLYIVKRLVELHGGRVSADSLPGQGSTFAIVLPRR